jgi:plasmid stabilization system protein ParE
MACFWLKPERWPPRLSARDFPKVFMDIPKFSKSDPLIVLLNEVEILLAQTRLMELHVKRAESLTGDRIARLQEEYQSELAALRSALAKSDEALAAQKSVLAGTPELRERIELLEEQLRAERQILEERDAEILHANSDIARLQDHVDQLESAGEWAQAKFEAAAREKAWRAISRVYAPASKKRKAARNRPRSRQPNSSVICKLNSPKRMLAPTRPPRRSTEHRVKTSRYAAGSPSSN